MENEKDKLIGEQKAKLPETLRLAIDAIPWRSTIKEIAVSNKLTFDQVDILERETMLILYGFESPDNYIDNIVREVPMESELANTIGVSVTERIFSVIESRMKGAENESESEIQNSLPEKIKEIHPMIEEGEGVHDVPHVESVAPIKTPVVSKPEPKPELKTSIPDYRYDGKDPYREPI